ncbi:ABC-F family ATP-binding cassette domain-containing protein [Nesterenkonia halotolerans]|uniref:ATPase subunit of ABC transporter with duplicated ATPase domains n=1 Tax=Nesterenkonia halotolerans TaxID=225325 RepID=A0ABR9J512_9MICC|nr:ABC-F family ATP-binding cassette domain-containing protein [Nesterenkonia halotolerans]MBE1514087.1 ATPase subunit of ABC transporter with duplicated ATPase domains [Nesterenkonia halotolerans]
MSAPSAITLHDLSFEWPDGTTALHQLNGTLTTGRTGLVGRNGAGKSTLLRLIAGHLTPTSGLISTTGDVGYLSQTLTTEAGATVAGLLGIEDTLSALQAIEGGDADVRHFDAVGDDWDIEARADAALNEIGFSAADLRRPISDVSGGEAMLIAITGLRLRRAPITLLDEPTNNLDRPTRAKLTEFVDDWQGTLVVVSHDLELLEHMDSTAELHSGRVDVFGGPYSQFSEHLEHQQAAAVQAARTAQQALRVEKKQRVEAETKNARRERAGKRTQASGGIPKILAGNRASKAQVSAGAMRSTHQDKVRAAQAVVDASDAKVRDDEHIHLALPDPGVPRGRKIAELRDGTRTVTIQGPERVALVGPNGSGKTTLLERLVHKSGSELPAKTTGELLIDRVGYLPQRLNELDESRSAVENVQEAAPASPAGDVRNQLARLLLRGSTVDRPVSSLSGGERFRVSLARLLLAEPPAQLLILDEPTNNLDITSVEQLAEALDAYRGALLVVSHDLEFLARLSIDTVIELDGRGALKENAQLFE